MLVQGVLQDVWIIATGTMTLAIVVTDLHASSE